MKNVLSQKGLILQLFNNAVASIFDYVRAPELETFWIEREQELDPYLGEFLFPSEQQLGMEITLLKGQTGAPVALRPSAFDAQAIPRNRPGFEQMLVDMIYFKESKFIYEKDRQQLLQIISSGNQRQIDIILRRIFDDITELVRAAALQREIMRMTLLTSGTTTVVGNGQNHFVDYGMPELNKGNAAVDWSDHTNANPIEDIRKAQEIITLETGIKPTRLILNSTNLSHLRLNKIINRSIAVFGDGQIIMNDSNIRSFLQSELGVTEVIVYDKLYRDDNSGTRANRKFIPDDVVVLVPPGNLGRTVFGTTPEEADLMNSNVANVAIVDTGVAITTSEKVDPVNVDTKVSMICLPTFDAMHHCYIMTVKGIQGVSLSIDLDVSPTGYAQGLDMTVAQLKEALDAKGVEYVKSATKAELEALLLGVE